VLARVVPALLLVGVVVGLGGCAADQPDAADVDRIAVMRSDTIYTHLVGDPDAVPGAEQGGAFLASTFAAPVDPWAGQNTPVGPSVDQRREAVAALVSQLRADGWTIISDRCSGNEQAEGDQAAGYQWEVFGYRIRDGVPYAVHLDAGYAETSGFGVRIIMTSPFHADPATYFATQPAPIAEGATCVEEPPGDTTAATSAHGSIWSLDNAKG